MVELLPFAGVPPAPSVTSRRPRLLVAALCAAAFAAFGAAPASAGTVPHEVVVAYRGAATPKVLRVGDVDAAIRRLQARRDVRYAVPNHRARAAGAFVPDDPGRGLKPGNWQSAQWNFTGPASVNAPDAWGNLIAAGRPGGKGVTIAVLDTGVAYRPFGPTPASPDFAGTTFVQGHDFIGHDRFADDRNGHGTHVTSTIAESTNNGIGFTGLAYGATIMPVKVLDDAGEGDAAVIARGVRYAAAHGAKIINLSLEFDLQIGWQQIPELIDAIAAARAKGAVVVAAAGNEAKPAVAYPARSSNVLSVGSTTEHGCLSTFSNEGPGLDIVAPGGGRDAPLQDPGCKRKGDGPAGRNIFQLTLVGKQLRHFGVPSDYQGTSMSVPHVSATAALVVASGILGPDPAPDAIERRLEATAHDLGAPGYDQRYGYGRVDAAAATDPAVPVS
jgi:serine protease